MVNQSSMKIKSVWFFTRRLYSMHTPTICIILIAWILSWEINLLYSPIMCRLFHLNILWNSSSIFCLKFGLGRDIWILNILTYENNLAFLAFPHYGDCHCSIWIFSKLWNSSAIFFPPEKSISNCIELVWTLDRYNWNQFEQLPVENGLGPIVEHFQYIYQKMCKLLDILKIFIINGAKFERYRTFSIYL